MELSNERIKRSFRFRLKRIFNFFLKGLLITLPIYATFYIISSLVKRIDKILELETPGLGFLIVIGGITIIGLIGSSFFLSPIVNLLDELLNKIPFVRTIYSSAKDLIGAFVGEKNKFSKPVLVELAPGVYKPGFITQDDLNDLELPGMMAVYFPHSYAFSGNLFLVENQKVKLFRGSTSAFMKFIVSGGVSDINQPEKDSEV
ncbi:MAG: DUF502 domain-containing protein [Bacteroidetes bacterium]|nr:DUF502 domain-containing protein [Bacteroidota bacterium]